MSHISLADLLPPDRIKVPLASTDKAGLIGELCSLVGKRFDATESEVADIRAAVLEREAVLSTGIGDGDALEPRDPDLHLARRHVRVHG
ncbi:MAG: hypothetical protein R3266_11135, partial [Gemmatimonadota bacterium]|nr:hypothetical protein [Gemmatimonadota bacterium]